MGAKLENDEVWGYGPETAYLTGIGNCEGHGDSCDVTYMINDYEETSQMLAFSEAQVTLYNGESVAGMFKITDCANSVSQDGNWWHVFTVNSKTNQIKWDCTQSASNA